MCSEPFLHTTALPPAGPGDISEDEWTIRAGRAVYTLHTTLPNFFETGLVSVVGGDAHEPESIYAPNIRLSYAPPTAFPKTLQVEGLPLYHASATFIRHTLGAFNTGLHVDLCKLHVHSPGPRQREIGIRTLVSGQSRLSGQQNEWDVQSTYTLSPHSGLIDVHVVESIHPAPHITFYDGLRAALARLAGIDGATEIK